MIIKVKNQSYEIIRHERMILAIPCGINVTDIISKDFLCADEEVAVFDRMQAEYLHAALNASSYSDKMKRYLEISSDPTVAGMVCIVIADQANAEYDAKMAKMDKQIAEIGMMIANGQSIHAIRIVREMTGYGLKQAKAIIDVTTRATVDRVLKLINDKMDGNDIRYQIPRHAEVEAVLDAFAKFVCPQHSV